MSTMIRMTLLIGAFAILVCISGARGAADKDEQQILAAIDRWDKGWRSFDAKVATADYSDDADWTNAFGNAEKGRAAIEGFLTKLFPTPQIRGRTSTPSASHVRFLRPDVAVVSSYRETNGQKTDSGAIYPTRKTHDQRVFEKRGGQWKIVSHLIMDEKEAKP